MMIRLVTVPLILVISLLIISFALSNRGVVDLALYPMPGTLGLPLFVPVLLAALVGALVGCFATWRNGSRHRKAARDNKKLAEQLDKQVAELRRELAIRPPPVTGQAVLSPPNPLVTPSNPPAEPANATNTPSAEGKAIGAS
jgi:Uncharacterized integral membrane protein